MILHWNCISPRERPSLRRLERVVRKALSHSLDADLIDPILDAADEDNPAAEYIVASALESAGEPTEAAKWYRRAADQGYRPAIERLGSPIPPSGPEHDIFY